MTRRKRHNLVASGVEKGIGPDEQRTDFQLHHGRKGRFQVLLGCGMDDLNPLTKFLRGRLQFRCLTIGDRPSLIHQCSHQAGCGTTSRSKPSFLDSSSVKRTLTPVTFPPGRPRLLTRPAWTGLSPVVNTTGIVEVAALAASAAGGPPAMMTATLRLMRSAMISGNRSY